MPDVYRCMIATAATVVATRALAAGFGPEYAGMWTAELSATGAAPATHYVSAGLVGDDFAAFIASASGLTIFDHRNLDGLQIVQEEA